MIPATIFFLTYYMAFILLAGYAEDFMGSSVYEGLTVGYCLALTQFVMVLVLGLMYLRKRATASTTRWRRRSSTWPARPTSRRPTARASTATRTRPPRVR